VPRSLSTNSSEATWSDASSSPGERGEMFTNSRLVFAQVGQADFRAALFMPNLVQTGIDRDPRDPVEKRDFPGKLLEMAHTLMQTCCTRSSALSVVAGGIVSRTSQMVRQRLVDSHLKKCSVGCIVLLYTHRTPTRAQWVPKEHPDDAASVVIIKAHHPCFAETSVSLTCHHV